MFFRLCQVVHVEQFDVDAVKGLDGLWLCRLFMLVWVVLGSFLLCSLFRFLVCCFHLCSECVELFFFIFHVVDCLWMVFEFVFLRCCWEVLFR